MGLSGFDDKSDQCVCVCVYAKLLTFVVSFATCKNPGIVSFYS